MTDPDPDPDPDRLTELLRAQLAGYTNIPRTASFDARVAELLAAEAANPVPDAVLWWCSFAGTDRHLGVAVVAAPGVVHAVRRTHELGINPGGEVRVVPVSARGIPENYRDRLLDRDESHGLDRLAASLLTEDDA